MDIYKGHFVKSNKKKWDRSLESDVQLERLNYGTTGMHNWQDPATWKQLESSIALNVNVTVIRDRIRRKYRISIESALAIDGQG